MISPASLPSLCDVSESILKDFESDSEADTSEMRPRDDQQFTKRVRIDHDDDLANQRLKHPSLDPRSIRLPQQSNSFPSDNIFPWGFGFCQSPLIPTSFNSFG